LKRSVFSILTNIVEGFGRYHYQENIQFCRQARGSLEETKDNLITARDLNQASRNECERLIESCDNFRKLLNRYIRYLKDKKDLKDNNSIT